MIEHWMKPMLPSQTKIGDIGQYRQEDWAAEAKLDGWRTIAHRNGDRVLLFNGRNGSEYTGHLPYLDEHLKAILPADTVIDGELISPLGHGGVQSVMFTNGSHAPTSGMPGLMLVIFDIIRLNGQDISRWPWSSRRALVEAIQVESPLTALSPEFALDLPQALEVALENGCEGIVIKQRSSRYENGRSAAWRKFKPQETCEAEVIGFKPGKAGGQWDGKVGAFEIRLLDNDATTTIKCGTDERHEDATAHPENWKGAIVEIKHHGLSKTGVPRHPQYLRRRYDREVGDIKGRSTEND